MLINDRPNEAVEDGIVTGVALVPVVPTVQWSHVPEQSRSRADFVTQLIATAEHAPQTCCLRRASAADAQLAYGAKRAGAGARTRQII